MIYIYARPVTKYNQECLRKWLTIDNCESNSQLAFAIQLQISSSEFSASKLILDLPGHASLIDSIPNAIAANVDSDYTNTANILDDKDFRYALRIQEEQSNT
ncbi:hypothetical protein OSTOST_17380, partial [Ostertagia ostertagi]